MEAQADPKRRAERESHQLAGDGLEMASRAALEAWQQRPRHPDESDVFRLGYRLACYELALVFRAMRKGEPPSKAEFEELRRLVFEDAAGEPPLDPLEAKIRRNNPPYEGLLSGADDEAIALNETQAEMACTPAPDCAPGGEDTASKP